MRVAELQVARFTGLEAPTDVVEVEPVRRADWVNANTESLRDLLEPAAARMAAAMSDATREAMRRPRCRRRCGPMSGLFDAARPAAAGHAGRAGARVPRRSGCWGSTTSRCRAIADPARCCSSCRTSRVRAGLVAGPDRVPDVRRAARGDAPVRVRAAVGARRFAELLDDFLSTLTIDVDGDPGSVRHDRRRRTRRRSRVADRSPRTAAVRHRARRRAAARSSAGSRRSWRRPRATATT